MAIYIFFSLSACLLIFIAVKGTEHQNKYFSIPAITVKARVYNFIAGALMITAMILVAYYSNEENMPEAETNTPVNRQTESNSALTHRQSGHREVKLYCCNIDTRAKVCELEIALGNPGFPCYCPSAEGASIICQ